MTERNTIISGAALALAAGAGPCLAAAGYSVAPAFGNTIVSTYPDGRTAELWLNAQGSYSGEGRRHDRSSGHWRVNGAKLCLKQSRPIPVPFSYCTPLPMSYQRGWSGKAPTGEAITIRLVQGHAAREQRADRGTAQRE